ncbi:hypothetical protein L596_024116 [Steinernema carpocapsae]|uniref:Uncharacterized protein n=1 Tax=Steinernema carpocapsae TaxID=34508 RepID=A0A4U5MFT0_STECR|nr:hypothetical protein L596_024116 [Steinernema carpocapsae]
MASVSVLVLLLLLSLATVSAYYTSWYEVAQGRSHAIGSPRNPLTIEDMMSGIKFRRSTAAQPPREAAQKRFHVKYVRGLNRQPALVRQRLYGE